MDMNEMLAAARKQVADMHNIVVLSAMDVFSAATNCTVNLGYVPYKRWKVIGAGCLITTKVADSEPEEFTFGTLASDADEVTDVDAVVLLTCCDLTSIGWQVGDMIYYGDKRAIPTPEEPEDGATCTITATEGAYWDTWQTKQCYLTAGKITTSGDTGIGLAFVVLEVDDMNYV